MTEKKKTGGLAGVSAGETALCTVGKEGAGLTYRGYDIYDLADNASFEEVAYLLIHDKLPTQTELDAYIEKIISLRGLPGALKIVLVSDRPLLPIIESPAMNSISKRLTHDFHLRPMSNEEAMRYVYDKLRAAGSTVPEFVFPLAVCTELWRASGGWPGILDRVALLALANSGTLPIPQEDIERPVLPQGTWIDADHVTADSQSTEPVGPPTLYVSHDGETLRELTFDLQRLLIGRSEHNDISINSKFVSRHHALLVRHGSATFLMDLNSSNGTFVNSRRVSNHVLVHDDVITLGSHRIKFNDPHATRRGSLDGGEFADTAIMKTLEDMRRLLAQENTEILPTITENLPTSGV